MQSRAEGSDASAGTVTCHDVNQPLLLKHRKELTDHTLFLTNQVEQGQAPPLHLKVSSRLLHITETFDGKHEQAQVETVFLISIQVLCIRAIVCHQICYFDIYFLHC